MGTRGTNEGKACEAVVRFLERRTGYDRSDVRCPEDDGNGPPVELRLRLGRQEYALEHTLIEPFENEIRDGVEFEEIATHIKEALSSFAGSACYRLVVPVGARLPRSEDARQRFVDWIVKRAEAMREEAPGHGGPWRSPLRWDACVRAKPPGFSGTFELARWPDAALMGRRRALFMRCGPARTSWKSCVGAAFTGLFRGSVLSCWSARPTVRGLSWFSRATTSR